MGGSTRNRAAQEAEEFFEADGGGGQNGSRGLDRQISDLERINDEAQRSMAEMRRLLESDGAAAGPESRAGKAGGGAESRGAAHGEGHGRGAAAGYRGAVPRVAREAAGGAVIGQDAFLNSLFTAFKRPGVTGTPEGKPAAVVVISGREGTGRHSALSVAASSLAQGGALKNRKISRIDLALYPNAEDGRLFDAGPFFGLTVGRRRAAV